jgi:DNA-binding YbaB/EbfC family protein
VDPGGQLNMQELLAQAQKMQQQLMSAQAELADVEIQGTAGGGLVTATVNGQGELTDLTIATAAIEGGDAAETAETIADLVLAAIRDATSKVSDLQQEKMGPLAEGLGGGLPGLGGEGLPGLGGGGLPGPGGAPGPGPGA